MTRDQYAEQLSAYTSLFVSGNPNHTDIVNIKQYTRPATTAVVYDQYKFLIDYARACGAVDIIDVGSGIGTSKIIDSSIKTANIPTDYFEEVEQIFNIEKDYCLSDCRVNTRWIKTNDKFDCVIIHRFLPWIGQSITESVLHNILRGVGSVLNDTGFLLYTPLNTQGIPTTSVWSVVDIPDTTLKAYKLTKAEIHYEINKTTDSLL